LKILESLTIKDIEIKPSNIQPLKHYLKITPPLTEYHSWSID